MGIIKYLFVNVYMYFTDAANFHRVIILPLLPIPVLPPWSTFLSILYGNFSVAKLLLRIVNVSDVTAYMLLASNLKNVTFVS